MRIMVKVLTFKRRQCKEFDEELNIGMFQFHSEISKTCNNVYVLISKLYKVNTYIIVVRRSIFPHFKI